jgi:hypothetical protein
MSFLNGLFQDLIRITIHAIGAQLFHQTTSIALVLKGWENENGKFRSNIYGGSLYQRQYLGGVS